MKTIKVFTLEELFHGFELNELREAVADSSISWGDRDQTTLVPLNAFLERFGGDQDKQGVLATAVAKCPQLDCYVQIEPDPEETVVEAPASNADDEDDDEGDTFMAFGNAVDNMLKSLGAPDTDQQEWESLAEMQDSNCSISQAAAEILSNRIKKRDSHEASGPQPFYCIVPAAGSVQQYEIRTVIAFRTITSDDRWECEAYNEAGQKPPQDAIQVTDVFYAVYAINADGTRKWIADGDDLRELLTEWGKA